MNVHQLEKDKLVKDWLRAKTKSTNTKKSYLTGLQIYTDFTKMSPGDLIDEAETEQIGEQSVVMRKRKINDHILDFKDYLESLDIAPLTVDNRLKAVRSFYNFFYIQLPSLPRSEKTAHPLQEHTIIPEKEDIREVLRIADPLEKAIILVGCASGLAAADISNLKVSDFINGYDQSTGITTLRLRRVKTGFDFITFLTPEASKAVQDYLDFRSRDVKDRHGRKEVVNKQKIVNNSEYLFICRHVPAEYLETGNEELRKLDEDNIFTLYQRLVEDSRLKTKHGKWNTLRSHNLRKYFNNQLKKAGCDIETKEFLMAHRTRESRGHYDAQIQDPEGLKEKYKGFIPYLTIEKELDILESPEFKKIKAENETLAREAVRATVERVEITNLKEELEQIRKEERERAEITTEFLATLSDPEVLAKLKNLSS
jgi:integrase